MENATSSTRKDKTASDALRVNLVFSERRETEMYGDLMNAGVGDRGAILKYWAYLGYQVAKGRLKPEGGTTKQEKPVKAVTQKAPPSAPLEKPPTDTGKKTSDNPKGVTQRVYEHDDIGGAEDLGLSF